MTERQVKVGRRTIRAGTADDAGRLCVTDRAPDGVSSATYRFYANRARSNPAPGPILVPDATGEHDEGVPLRDGASGGNLYDLDAVQEWNAGRTGRSGYHRDAITADNVPHTAARAGLLQAAREGRLQILPGPKQRPRALLDGTVVDRRTGQAVSELRSWGLLGAPSSRAGKVPLTAAGREALRRWQVQ